MDASVYNALVGLSQPWNMRYPLIDFHGSNGSRDGDEAASSRYSECRLSKYAELMLKDIDQDTVDFKLNFDDTRKEPVYLPGAFPHLLCNGTTGIAVSVSANFLPHCLSEIMNAVNAVIDNPDISIEEILDKYISGPDFPTGGIVINKKDLLNAYKTGKGKVKLRGEYHLETIKGYPSIVFTSIPYKISKEDLALIIDEKCESGDITGVLKIRDESTRGEVRFVITLDKKANVDLTLRQLFAHTKLENSYSYNMVALVDDKPELLNIKQLLDYYISQQKEVLRRKTIFQKNKIEAKLIILKGLIIALEDIDNIIELIKKSENANKAKERLKEIYHLNEEQAKAIIEMKLGRLAKLEKIEIEKEIDFLEKELSELNEILTSKDKVNAIMKDNNRKMIFDYGDNRITKIEDLPEINVKVLKEEMVQYNEDCKVIVTKDNKIKRISLDKKIKPKELKEAKQVFDTNTLENIVMFLDTNETKVLPVIEIPEDRYVLITTIATIPTSTRILHMDIPKNFKDKPYVFIGTKMGKIKRMRAEDCGDFNKKIRMLTKLNPEDKPVIFKFLSEDEDVILYSEDNRTMYLKSEEIPILKKRAVGVISFKDSKQKDIFLKESAIVNKKDKVVLIVGEKTIKKLPIDKIPKEGTYKKGHIYLSEDIKTILSFPSENNTLILDDKEIDIKSLKD